jgi:carbamoyl-phosphate synthase large subunit
METILVSGTSGIVGYGILRSLSAYHTIGTAITEDSIAPAFCDEFEKILPTSDERYIDDLFRIIYKYGVSMIIPSIECDLYKWNEYREALSSITFPLLNNKRLIDLCNDKWDFYLMLMATKPKYAIHTTFDTDYSVSPFPLLLKPRHGFGSKGIVRIESERELDPYRSRIGTELMIQPIIGTDDEEYTVSGFFDKQSNLVDYFPLRRRLSKDGFTGSAIVEDCGFGDILSELAEVFKPIGATNFQFRKDGDRMKLLEINPRISSATSIRAAFGYNESEMSVEYFLHNKLPKPFKKPIGRKAIRFTEDYIF